MYNVILLQINLNIFFNVIKYYILYVHIGIHIYNLNK